MGFGVQSPWAYEFVSDVLFGKHRYYVFDTLKGKRSDEQLYRICAWLNPVTVQTYGTSSTTDYYLSHFPTKHGRRTHHFLYFAASSARDALSVASLELPACLVLDDLLNPVVHQVWDALLNRPDCTSTFDLGHRGILFFDPSRQKQNYLI